MMTTGISAHTPIRQALNFGKKDKDVWQLRDELKEVERQITSIKAKQFLCKNEDEYRALQYQREQLENKQSGINYAINRALD